MSRKLMTSAFALTAVLAFSALPAAAMANPWSGGPDIDDSFNDNSTDTDVDVGVDVSDSLNDNSTNNSNNDNSNDLDVAVSDSLNDNSTNDSGNDNRDYDDSFNDNSKVEDSNNDNREYKSDIDDSFNSKIEDSYNSDSSTNDSGNDNSDNSSWRISLTLQDLDANVSGFDFDVGGGHKDGKLSTGDISNSGGAFAGFAGIQTANYNTGFASNNQAATAISANANVTFGGGGGN